MTNNNNSVTSSTSKSDNFAEHIKEWTLSTPTACLVLADGSVIMGKGLGAQGINVGELCFNTSITGYQEILTDPSYMQQIICFTFPHIGNVGTNSFDVEDYCSEKTVGAIGAIFKSDITNPANYRSQKKLDLWLKERGIIAISGVDTRALTHHIRKTGAPNTVIAHSEDGKFDFEDLKKKAKEWSGLNGLDLAQVATTSKSGRWNESTWNWENKSYKNCSNCDNNLHIVVIDYGIKRNILRLLHNITNNITIVNAKTPASEILKLNPTGIFLSNGPGDPFATGKYAIGILQDLLKTDIPIFGICLGHQLLALAVGAKTIKMQQGHRGANHPVKDVINKKVEIVSMNHGFAVDRESLPENIIETHYSLFDNTNCGMSFKDKNVFSVQHHPEASPGPQDSYHLFDKFKKLMQDYNKENFKDR